MMFVYGLIVGFLVGGMIMAVVAGACDDDGGLDE